jgi:Domain of unknown function (DUF4279)
MKKRFCHDYKGCSRTYATLCIYHEHLAPENITLALNITPDRTVKKGDKAGLSTAQQYGWFFKSKDNIDSKDLGAHIQWIIEQLKDKHKQIMELKNKGFEMKIMCFWGSAFGNGGPEFDSQMLRDLGNMHVSLQIDVWFE